MKKAIFGGVFVVLVLSWGAIHNFITAPQDFATLHEEDVILYGTSWCPNCAQTRRLLKAGNVPYFEYDVDNSSEGQRQFKALNGNGVPVILIKNTVIRGYSPNAIFRALKENKIISN